MSHPMCYTVRITIKENMRTTYRGQNRAQTLKAHREILAYQKAVAEGKAQNLKEKYFAEPSLWERVKRKVKEFIR